MWSTLIVAALIIITIVLLLALSSLNYRSKQAKRIKDCEDFQRYFNKEKTKWWER